MNKASILLVDDEKIFAENLSKLLTRRGYLVTIANDGLTAIRMMEEEDLDVVLLDLRMPGINGIETLKEIKTKKPEIQVIILTGHGDIESAVQAVESGAFDFRTKPIQLDSLLERVEKAFRKKTIKTEELAGR